MPILFLLLLSVKALLQPPAKYSMKGVLVIKMVSKVNKNPLALFDTIDFHLDVQSSAMQHLKNFSQAAKDEYKHIFNFLTAYTGSPDTFNAYRREVERFFHWAWLIHEKGIFGCDRLSIQAYLKFVRNPPESWRSNVMVPRFVNDNGLRVPNDKWRPFLNKTLSDKSLQALVASLSTMYAYLVQEGCIGRNPVLMLRQKKQYIQNAPVTRVTRKLTAKQWSKVIEVIQKACVKDDKYERHLFLLSMFYLLGLRISEVSQTDRRLPMMTDFIKDAHDCYWYTTVGKGNKYREIAVSDVMLDMLIRFRRWLRLDDYPVPGENIPLCPKFKGSGGLGIRQVRNIIQHCFDMAIVELEAMGDHDEAKALSQATVHWLRHTSISADVQYRPREHVRDDAGHDNVTITDRYIDVDQQARHDSARKKPLVFE
ncbi:MAG: site-specific integrase [Gammaproteobacteria bacterium]|nr:site-specific integrase [Gammaproteobacteria bacterium]